MTYEREEMLDTEDEVHAQNKMYDQRDLDCLVGLDTSGPSSQQSKVPTPRRCLSLKEGSWLLLAPGPLPSAPHALLPRRERCTLGVATSGDGHGA